MTTTEQPPVDVQLDGKEEEKPEVSADSAAQPAEPTAPRTLPTGPIEGVEYPLKVVYCGVCSLPVEYCQYYPNYDKCREWLETNLPDEFNKLNLDQDDGKAKGRQKRGGKGLIRVKKKTGSKKVELFRSNRGKKKWVTVCRGLQSFDVDLKEATKLFASKFACGSSVTGEGEIVVQGDVKDDLIDLIQKHWPDIEDDFIEDLGDKKY